MVNLPPEFDTRNIIDEYKGLSVDEIKSRITRNNFSVATFNVEYNINIGNMMRTSNAFAGREFIIVGRKHWDRRGAVGVHNYETVLFFKEEQELISWAKEHNRPLIGIDLIPQSIPTTQILSYDENPIFVFGHEGKGLSQTIIDACSKIVCIKQYGTVRSMNVASACAIMLYDWVVKNGPKI